MFLLKSLGSQEKAYTVDLAAWQHYLLFRDEANKEDLDSRLMYHAIANRWELGSMSLSDFNKLGRADLVILMQGMVPGGDYPRPSVEEANLTTEPPTPEPTPEMLRAQEEEDAALEDQVSDKLDIVIRRDYGRRPSFKEILEHEEMLAKNLGYSPKKMKTIKRKRLNPYPRKETFKFHPGMERQLNLRLNKFLDDVIDQGKSDEPSDPRFHISINDTDDPIATKEFLDRKLLVTQGSPVSASTLQSWSGSGWASTADEESRDSLDEVAVILPLDEDGRIQAGTGEENPGQVPIPEEVHERSLKPEVSWEASMKAQDDVLKVLHADDKVDLALTESREELHDETVLSLLSSLSGIEVLDRSSELESHPRHSSDEARNYERDDSFSSFNDSVEVFLAKQAKEDEIITLSSGSDTSGVATPTDDPVENVPKASSSDVKFKRGPPPEIGFLGTRYRWNVPAQGTLYPGGFVDDLAHMGIPRELWPFPVDDEEITTTTPEAGCDYKHEGKED